MMDKEKKYKYILEVESNLFGAHASCAVYDMLKNSDFEQTSFRNSHEIRPSGLYNDSIEDCYKRADSTSSAGSHSGTMCGNKDLRRVVLLSHYGRALESKISKLKENKACDDLESRTCENCIFALPLNLDKDKQYEFKCRLGHSDKLLNTVNKDFGCNKFEPKNTITIVRSGNTSSLDFKCKWKEIDAN